MEKKTLAIATLLVVGLLGVSLVSAAVPGIGLTEEERTALQEERQAQREAIRSAIQEGDYDTWESLMRQRLADMESRITEENFEELQERDANRQAFKEAVEELKESGELDRESFQELKEQYGIQDKPGRGKAYHKGFKQGVRFGHGLNPEA